MIEKMEIQLSTSRAPKRFKIGLKLLEEAKRRLELYIEPDMILAACLFNPLIEWEYYPFDLGKKERAMVSCFS